MLLTEYDEKKTMRLLRREAKEEGRKEGREEGIKEGIKEGMQKGLKEGIEEERCRLVEAMLGRGISAEEIAQMTGLSLQEIKDVQDILKKAVSK